MTQTIVTGPVSVRKNKMVVRLRTTCWHDANGAYTKKSITFLKRKSEGFNCLAEECSNIGAEEVIPSIINLDTVEDGIYEVILAHQHRDWETGYVEDWDYELIPYSEC